MQRPVRPRTLLRIGEITPKLAIDGIESMSCALPAHQGAYFGFDGGIEHRRRAGPGKRRREGGALPYPEQAKGPVIQRPAAARTNPKDIPNGFVGLLRTRDFAAVFGQARARRTQEGLS